MQEHFTSDEAARFLRHARMGGIVGPEQLRSELRHVKQRPAIGSYAVGASVPNWLVEKLDPNKRLAHNYTVYPTLDRLDTVLLATMQCANTQLRCVLQLSDPLTNAFLQDALKEKLFTLLFSIENTRQCAVSREPCSGVYDKAVWRTHAFNDRTPPIGVSARVSSFQAPEILASRQACVLTFCSAGVESIRWRLAVCRGRRMAGAWPAQAFRCCAARRGVR